MNPRRLYRSRTDHPLTGLAGGLAEYFDLDPSLVRILWIVSIIFGGLTIFLYVVMAIVVPLEPYPGYARQQSQYYRSQFQGWAPPAPGPVPQSTSAATGAPGEPGSTDAQGAPTAGSPADATTGTSYAGPTDPTMGWQPMPPMPPMEPPASRGSGQGGFILGILFVLFGALALADQLIPGWGGAGRLWPAFIVGVGALLLVGSFRRGATSR